MGSHSNSFPSNTIPVVSIFANSFGATNGTSSAQNPLARWPGIYQSPVINALLEARPSMFEQILDPHIDAPPQTELHTKTPSESRISIGYSFTTDNIIREQYIDPWNEIRMGKLLEDLDALAGTIAYEHCSDDINPTRPLLLVTASVDKIVLKKPIRVDADLKIVGAVAWVGRSSITVRLEVIGQDEVTLTAHFTFAARDSKTGKSAPVNRLSPVTKQEKKLYDEMEAIDRLRKEKRGQRGSELEKGKETDRLNALLAENRVFSDTSALANSDRILMGDTRLENSLLCQPQYKNIHGRIFGGFLMNTAFELAYSTAYVFAGLIPCFVEVDHVDFLRPVDVGDFLRLKSCVLYTEFEHKEQPLINVEVVAHVTRPELRSTEVSNTFYFTFTVDLEVMRTNGLNIRRVVPATEEEARRVLARIDARKP